jgi:acyl-coenzyme A thioesterase PaaI-like protein
MVLEGESSQVSFEVTPRLCDRSGALRLGVIATAIDLCAGGLAGSKAAPDWVATSDLSVHVVEPVREGRCAIDCRIVRRGRFLVVLEQSIRRAGEPEGRHAGQATAAFSILPSRGEAQGGGRDDRRGVRELSPGSRAELDLLDRIGARLTSEAEGCVELELSDYVRNTFGALQGGAVAVLAEAALEAAAGVPLADLAVRYLAQGRVGPFRTEVRRTRGSLGEWLGCVVRDLGSDGRLVAMASGRPIAVAES